MTFRGVRTESGEDPEEVIEEIHRDDSVSSEQVNEDPEVHFFEYGQRNQNQEENHGGENMGRIDENLQDAYDEAVANGVDAADAIYQAAEQAKNQTRDAESKMRAVQTAVYELETYAATKIGEARAARAAAEAQKNLIQDELSDRQDSLDDMTDDLIG